MAKITWLAALFVGLWAGMVRGETDWMTLGGARWIWFDEGNPAVDAPMEARFFRTTFEAPADAVVRRARMLATADNAYTAWVNGKQVASSEQMRDVRVIDLAGAVRAGRNSVAIRAWNIYGAEWAGKNPAGLIAKLEIELADGRKLIVPTDKTWKSATKAPAEWNETKFDDADWKVAKELAPAGGGPWGGIGPAELEVISDGFPRFIVPGHEAQMESLRRLFWHHYQRAGPAIPLWDEWLSISTLWEGFDAKMPQRWEQALESRKIDAEGYVSCQQHDGTGHSAGWPFPLWHQGAGIGWHYAPIGVNGYEPPIARAEGWTFQGVKSGKVGAGGWEWELSEANATAQPPAFAVEVLHAPFVRLNWRASGLGGARPFVEWTTAEKPKFDQDRRVYFEPVDSMKDGIESRTMLAMYKQPQWKGVITGLRINFGNTGAAKVVLKSFHTAYDTRQNVNNPNYVVGCCNTFAWTGDVEFLRRNIGNIRRAMNFTMSEFETRTRKCVYTPWVGHDGLTGVERESNGRKNLRVGHGIGSDYWDILPFGAEDCLATIYYYHAVRRLAGLEEDIARNPQWKIPAVGAFDPKDLRDHANEVKAYAGQKFWVEKTGRFGSGADVNGANHDYGFTFLNSEAIYYDFATKEQAESIEAWMTGSRKVEGDTAQGDDIYRWRFGPRATTRRNLDWYFWGWSSPESIGFGDQVQDGGAVLGFSYFDMMARMKTLGANLAEARLEEICRWFDDTQMGGGYRAYYSAPGRGSMQGGNHPGGLGIDMEFMESALVPQVMLYGFLGFRPTPEGFAVDPKLPDDWPSLTITGIRLRGQLMDITAERGKVTVKWINSAKPDTVMPTPATVRFP